MGEIHTYRVLWVYMPNSLGRRGLLVMVLLCLHLSLMALLLVLRILCTQQSAQHQNQLGLCRFTWLKLTVQVELYSVASDP